MRNSLPACSLAIATGLLVPLIAQAPQKTVWDGVYSDTQSKRGEAVYAGQCSRCHADDLTGQQSRLLGDRFMRDWSEDSVGSLFRKIKTTMPRGAAGTLPEAQYLDVTAFVLQSNGFPSGADELTLDLAPNFLIIGKDGPQPVPEFALVQVAGCLTQSGINWVLTSASEPFRTRAPELSSDDMRDPRILVSGGTGSFKLLEAQAYKPDAHKDHRVAVKGLLIRRPDSRLNVTALDTLAEGCAP